MPSTVQEHYDNLLAEHYDWMFGVAPDAKIAEQRTLLHELLLDSRPPGLAVDLGCGSGFQTLALADLGYAVLAVDSRGAQLSVMDQRPGRLVTLAARKSSPACGRGRDGA